MARARVGERTNVVRLDRNKVFRFTAQDPDMEFICGLMDRDERSHQQIRDAMYKLTGGAYGISCTTLYNWEKGKTRRPQNHTLTWVAYTLGYQRTWQKL